jgi:4-hydroxybenzoate polyprenyltransferase
VNPPPNFDKNNQENIFKIIMAQNLNTNNTFCQRNYMDRGRMIEKLEKNRATLHSCFVIVLFYAIARGIIEEILVFESTGILDLGSMTSWAIRTSFYITGFIVCVLIMRIFTRRPVRKIVNFLLCFYWIILLPPILHRIIFGPVDVEHIAHFKIASPIVFFTLLFISTAVGLFVFFRCTPKVKKRVVRRTLFSVFSAISTFFLVIFLSMPLPYPILDYFFNMDLINTNSLHLYFFLYYITISLILLLTITYLSDKKMLTNIVKAFRPLRTSHFALMVCIGILVAGNLLFPYLNDANVTYVEQYANDFPYILTSILLGIIMWQTAVMSNDVFDIEIDRISSKDRPLVAGTIKKSTYIGIVHLLSIFVWGVVILIGLVPFLITLILYIMLLLYNTPPYRMRNYTSSSIFIGLTSMLIYFLGYFTSNFESLQNALPGNAVFMLSVSPTKAITQDALVIGLLILCVLSVSPILTQLKDYEGDKKAGVRTIYTVYGLKKGKNIATLLLPILFLTPLLLFHNVLDVVFLIILTTIATITFHKKGDVTPVFGCYLIFLIYGVLRWIEYIPGI